MEARRCPICKREIRDEKAFGPFCSARCKMADLGEWLSGRYRISAPAAEEDLDEGVPKEPGSTSSDGDPEGDSSDD